MTRGGLSGKMLSGQRRVWAHEGQPGNAAASLPEASHPEIEATCRGQPSRASCRAAVEKRHQRRRWGIHTGASLGRGFCHFLQDAPSDCHDSPIIKLQLSFPNLQNTLSMPFLYPISSRFLLLSLIYTFRPLLAPTPPGQTLLGYLLNQEAK